jgi:predicted ArsR family transcriptional regulator
MATRLGLPEGTKRDILTRLARQELSTQALADELEVSPAAVRQHLDTLEALGLVERRKQEVTQPSRPTYLYRLSARGSEAFPKRYDLLLSLIVDVIGERDGGAAVEEVVKAAARRLADRVRPRFAADDAEARWAAVLEWLEDELRWQADVETDRAGHQRIVIHQCPFREVASTRPAVCEVFFGTLLRALREGVEVQASPSPPAPACCQLVLTPLGPRAARRR